MMTARKRKVPKSVSLPGSFLFVVLIRSLNNLRRRSLRGPDFEVNIWWKMSLFAFDQIKSSAAATPQTAERQACRVHTEAER